MPASKEEPDAPRDILERFLCADVSASFLQEWIYGNDSLASFFGEPLYSSLLNSRYETASDARELRAELGSFFEARWPGRLAMARIRSVCDRILTGNLDIKSGCRYLASTQPSVPWIAKLFVGFDSELDSVPGVEVRHLWHDDAWLRLQEPITWYRESVLVEVTALREELDRRLNLP